MAIIAGAGAAVYLGTLDAPFIFDDLPAIVLNESIRDLTRLDEVLQPPSTGSNVGSRPLVNLTLAFNYAAGGLHPRGYHLFNLAVHLLAGLTLFAWLRRLFALSTMSQRVQRNALPAAFCTAVLWTLHPLQTETVIYTAQRTESLVALFFLLTLYCFTRALTGKRPRLWYRLAWSACLAGMATKEVMAGAPLVLFLCDRTFFAGTWAAAWRQRWRWHLGFAATWLLLMYVAVIATGGQRGESAGFGLGVSPVTYALTQARAIVTYLRLALWPHPLVIDYGTWLAPGVSAVALELCIVLVLLVATAIALIRAPRIGFAAASSFLVLAPSSSIVPILTQTMAEHRLYLPLAAILALLVLAVFTCRTQIGFGLALAAAVAAGVGTVRRGADYRDEVTLWRDLVAKTPDNGWAHVHLGDALVARQEFAEALAVQRRAMELMPQNAGPPISVGIALTKLGRPADALPYFARGLQLKPDNPQGHFRHAMALLALNRPAEALAPFAAAVRLAPDYADAEANWGVALFQLGRFDEAVSHFEQLLRLRPTQPDAHYNLALTLVQLERQDAALPHFQAAARLNPRDGDIQFHLAGCLAELGRAAEAVPHFEQAVQLRPGQPLVHYHFAQALRRLGRGEEARQHFARAQELAPDFAPARQALEELNAGAR